MASLAAMGAVYLIACHGGPADHFATFAEQLSKEKVLVKVYASGPALSKFEQRGIKVAFPFCVEGISSKEEDVLAEQIAKTCSLASVVITDLGHTFDIKLQKALADHAGSVTRFAYYENPESYVPGGYSVRAAAVIQEAQGVLFANANLAETSVFEAPGKVINLTNQKRIGIGYYPIDQAEKIIQRRLGERAPLRETLFSKLGMSDTGQRILVYFGGNNEDYFSKAFPAFLQLLEEGIAKSDLSQTVILFQQHPGAKTLNLDGAKMSDWIRAHEQEAWAPKIRMSCLSSDEVQVLADGALYWQTSMGPLWALSGIPAIQVGHETFEDILVRNRWAPSVMKVDEWLLALDRLSRQEKVPSEKLLQGLGIRSDWFKVFLMGIGSLPVRV